MRGWLGVGCRGGWGVGISFDFKGVVTTNKLVNESGKSRLIRMQIISRSTKKVFVKYANRCDLLESYFN